MTHHSVGFIPRFFEGRGLHFLVVSSSKFPRDLKALGGTNKEYPEETEEETLLREIREEGKDEKIEIGQSVLVDRRLVTDDHAQCFYVCFGVENLQGIDEVRHVDEVDESGRVKETLTVRWVSQEEFEKRIFPKQKEAYKLLLRMPEMKKLK